MIGSGYKKYAAENGMQIAHGVAYGSLHGFAATLSEGSGYKQIVLTTKFTDPEQKERLMTAVNSVNISRTYRVQNLEIGAQMINIVFTDNPGTMKKIRAFVDWFMPLLQQHSATGVNVCSECGTEATDGRWVLINGVACYMHGACAQKAAREIEDENVRRKEESTGSYLTGTLGALIGSAIGAVAWAIVLNMGYVASLVGLLIGWLAEKGYNLLKGKQGKAKVLILILVVIFGVLLGNFLADVITLFSMISGGELPGMLYGDIPGVIMELLATDAEYRGATISNVLIGLLFAGLGVFALLRKAGKAVADHKFIEL